jgi:hypothetical protein
VSLTNLTPHPVRIYGWEVPDRFPLGEYEPLLELPPSGTVARIGEIDLGGAHLRGCDAPVEMVEYRHFNGLPPKREGPWDGNTVWYVVSLPLALSCCEPRENGVYRSDLLVPFREVRNPEGTVIGCRSLAIPV